LPQRDVEGLSAYVDGALSPRERSALEARLARDDVLRQALDELRSIKTALASLPERRVPRSFALREADVRRSARRPGFAALRFATVLAGGLFILTTMARSLPMAARLGAAAPAMPMAAEVQGEVGADAAGTSEPDMELRAEAPAAAPEEGLADTLLAATTATPAATACPDCLQSVMTTESQALETADEFKQAAPAEARASPLAAVQWALALTAILLGTLTVRARRR
jgi:hypothetical protein